jgi:pilus assembly protein FimV
MENENIENLEPEIQSEISNEDTLTLDELSGNETGKEEESSKMPTEDLEKYGVWVKVEPSEVEDTETEKEEKPFNLEDLESEETPGKAGAETLEEDLGIDEEISSLKEEAGMEEVESLESSAETKEEMPIDLELEEEIAESGKEAKTPQEEERVESLEELSAESNDIKEVSLDELGISIDTEAAEDQEKKTFETTPTVTEDFAIHDEVTTEGDDSVPPLDIDLEIPADENETDKIAGEEIIFDEGTEEEKIEPMEDLPELETESKEEMGEIELEEIGEEEQLEEPEEEIALGSEEVEVPLSLEPNIGESYEELEGIEEKTDTLKETIQGRAAEDISSKILLSIEEELKSIKKELFALKQEIGSLRIQKPTGKAEGIIIQKEDQELGEKSFFAEGEEEDETIALTGEELDNILVTADIREEQEEKTSDLPEETLELVDQEDILDYQADKEKEQPKEEKLEELEGMDLEEIPSPEATEEGEKLEVGADLLTEEKAEEMEPEVLSEEEGLPEFEMAETEIEEPGATEPYQQEAVTKDEIEIEIPELEEEQAGGGKGDGELDSLEGLEVVEETQDQEPSLEKLEEELSIEPITEIPEEEKETSTLAMDIEEVPTESISASETAKKGPDLSPKLKEEIKSVLSYMDQLLEALPEEKIQEFAHSEYFEVYKRLFEELGLAS